MVTFVPGFVSQQIAEVWLELLPVERAWDDELRDDPHEVRNRVRAWMAEHPYPAATVGQVADHIDHVREVAGLAHVGIGGD